MSRITTRKQSQPSSVKVIREPEFARRLEQAADAHPHCLPLHHGRQVWVAEEMKKRGHPVSTETVKKWFHGQMKPQQDKAIALAEVMQVDAGWLQLGLDANLSPRDRKLRNAMVSGVVNLVAGIIQIDGGHPAFPEEGDARAQREHVDLYAIVRGANYAFHVTLGETEGRRAKFAVPTGLGENVIVIGVIRDGFAFDLFEVTPEVIEQYGKRHGGSVEVVVDGSKLKQITGFTTRL